jgi:hypothetical protein
MQHKTCITVVIVTHFAAMELFEIRTWSLGIIGMVPLYFDWCNKKAPSRLPLPHGKFVSHRRTAEEKG